ncbi:hypothetical protein BX070DRAFT_222900 [Coemansia spiralis]|nr:hypothetical protein BX070DRAFT_222900 [Coemansia spiralis]
MSIFLLPSMASIAIFHVPWHRVLTSSSNLLLKNRAPCSPLAKRLRTFMGSCPSWNCFRMFPLNVSAEAKWFLFA